MDNYVTRLVRTSGKNVYLLVCTRCGSFVQDGGKHNQWHEDLMHNFKELLGETDG